MNLAVKILYMRRFCCLKKLSYFLLKIIGVEIPLSVKFGENIDLVHWSYGTVIHPNTTIEDNVKIYQNVTFGRSDVQNVNPSNINILVKKNSIIGAGAKILTATNLVIEERSIVGANCVLLTSTEKNSVYVGIPGKKIESK